MEWPMKKEMHFNDEIESSNQPLLRLYNPTYAGKNIFGTEFPDSIIEQLNSDDFYQGQWQNCDSNSFKDMSAVGYYFGKNIISEMNVPIGLINMSIGGAPIETFINPEAMKSNAQFRAKVNGNWLTNDALPVWVRERGKQNIGSDSVNNNHPFKPGYAFQNGINGITPFPIKGILWYQGESNAQEADRVYEYGALMKLMIDDYRKQWSQIDLPFYFVQLSSIDTTHYKGQLWPMFRDEQRKSLAKIDFSGMAVCSDVGSKDDVHPRNKKIVGERLARWALSKTYKKDIFPSGPLPLSAKYEEGKVVIAFQYGAAGLKSSDGNKVKGFSIDGKSEINAEIVNDTIVLFVNEKPEYIYYGWQPYSNANLVNSEVLPASTFKIAIQ
jgi:sialate O-acetylesterase